MSVLNAAKTTKVLAKLIYKHTTLTSGILNGEPYKTTRMLQSLTIVFQKVAHLKILQVKLFILGDFNGY